MVEAEPKQRRQPSSSRSVLIAVVVLAALVAVVAAGAMQPRGTPQMRATLEDSLLDAELPGAGKGKLTVQHEGKGLLGKPHYDGIHLTFDVPEGAAETEVLHRAVTLAQQHGWPLKQSDMLIDREFWSCTKTLPGGQRAEMSTYLVDGGPSGFTHNGVEEIDPTRVVFIIKPLNPGLAVVARAVRRWG